MKPLRMIIYKKLDKKLNIPRVPDWDHSDNTIDYFIKCHMVDNLKSPITTIISRLRRITKTQLKTEYNSSK